MTQEILLYSKHFENITEENKEKVQEILSRWIEAIFLEPRDFTLSDREGIPLDALIEEGCSFETFIQKIEKQIHKLERMNQWLEQYPKEENRFFAFMEYVYTRKGKEEVAQNLLRQNVDLEWVSILTGLSEEELEDL